jgi:hypothetical protein
MCFENRSLNTSWPRHGRDMRMPHGAIGSTRGCVAQEPERHGRALPKVRLGSRCSSVCTALGVLLLVTALPASSARGESIELSSSCTYNTIYQYQYDPSTVPDSNGGGLEISAGYTGGNRGQVQRGLIRFDFQAEGVPAEANIQSVSLELFVSSVPRRATRANPFWLVAIKGLDQPWGEADTLRGPAQKGDATWYHTQFNPDDPGSATSHLEASGDLKPFAAGAPGFWPEKEGYLGQERLTGTEAFVAPELAFWVGTDVGFVTWSSPQMVADVQRWVDDPTTNFGWMIVGEEWIEPWIEPYPGNDDPSSKRDFASREDTRLIEGTAAYPRLRVTYAVVPEPGCAVLLASALAVVLWRRRCRP